MGYNTSRKAFTKYRGYFELMKDSRKDLKFPSDNPKELADGLRHGRAAAKKHEDLKEYADRLEDYRFKVENDHVVAEFMGELEVVAIEMEENVKVEKLTITRDDNTIEGYRTFENVYGLIEILGTLLSNLDATELTFSKAIISYEDKLKLFKWTKEESNTGWRIIDMEDKGIVLTRDTTVPFEMTWMPKEE